MERRQLYGGVVVLTGTVLAVVQVVHAFQQSSKPAVVVVDAVPMVAVALALAFAGTQVARDPVYEPDLSRILGWAVGGVVVFASFAALGLFSQNVTTGSIVRANYVAVDNLTVGATAGVLVGLYDARSEQRRRQLEAERDAVERFAGKAADLNNYGRAVAQADDVSGVSAFTVEAVSTLLAVDQTAFLEVRGDELRVIDSTLVGVDDATLATLVERRLDGDVGSVSVEERPAADGDDAVGTVVTVPVARLDGSTFLLVSLTDDERTVDDTDRELLALLSSHVAMALEGVQSRATV